MKNQLPIKTPYKKKPADNNEWMKYSSIAFQIVAIMLVGIGIGYFLDKQFVFRLPVFKLIFFFGAVIIALYSFIKQVSNRK